jgi:hypothetical protein
MSSVRYAVNADNDLLWFRHYGHDTGLKVGAGWDFKQLCSG